MAKAIWLAAVLGIAAALFATAGPAGRTATRQRIAIEERAVSDAPTGTFRLIPLTAGPIKSDSGKVSFSLKRLGTVTTSGQRVTTYRAKETLTGRRGVIEIRARTESTDAGGEYLVGSGTWSVASGTRAYAGLRGGGAESGVLTPRKVIFTRYEGWVTVP